MKKQLCRVVYGVLWLFTGCIGLLNLICARQWWDLSRYAAQYGAEENPYAAEDAYLAGIFAVFLMVLFLCLLAALWGAKKKKLVKPSDENEATKNQ